MAGFEEEARGTVRGRRPTAGGELYEVEQKYPVPDAAAVEERLTGMGARWHAAFRQVDRYFAHPSRDFAVTDEALRLRSDASGVAITWKGPRLASAAKARREIELPLAAPPGGPPASGGGDGGDDVLVRWTELLEALGFRRVREVLKRRLPGMVAWQAAEIALAVDRVDGLGDFVELELQADAAGIASASSRIESLARAIGCACPERRSYLEMLLAVPR